MKRPPLILLGLLAVPLFASGCGTSKASRFYTLDPVAAQNSTPSVESIPASSPSIGIMPVEIPDYLDRPEIVTRNADNGLKLAEFDRWAGDLDKDIARVLAETMAARLPADSVFVLTGRRAIPADYSITVHVTRFDPFPGDVVVLKAVWTVLAKDGHQVMARGESNLDEPIRGRDYQATVTAMSRAVDKLGREISNALEPGLAQRAAGGAYGTQKPQ